MIKRSIPLVFMIYVMQMVVGSNLYFFLIPRYNNLVCLSIGVFYAGISFYLVEILAIPPAFRSAIQEQTKNSPEPRKTRQLTATMCVLQTLYWSSMLYIALFVPPFNDVPLVIPLEKYIGWIFIANFFAILLGCILAVIRLASISDYLYSSMYDGWDAS